MSSMEVPEKQSPLQKEHCKFAKLQLNKLQDFRNNVLLTYEMFFHGQTNTAYQLLNTVVERS